MLDPNWSYVATGSGSPDTYLSTEYSEALGAGDVSTSPGSYGATRIFYTLHSQMPAFLDDLLGWAIVDANGDIIRTLPDPHPLYANLYAVEATGTGKGKLGQYYVPVTNLAKYDVAQITCQYRPLTYEVKADADITTELDRFVTRQYGFGGDAITLNNSAMRFVSNFDANGVHTSLSQPPAKPTMTMDLQYTWHWVPANPDTSSYIPPNLAAILNCYGKVNSVQFDENHMDCDPGTVLFLGVEPRFTNYRIAAKDDQDDNLYWEIAMKFLYRDNGFVTRGSGTTSINETAGHQFIWDQANTRFDLITTTGLNTGGRLYETADLNTLFEIG